MVRAEGAAGRASLGLLAVQLALSQSVEVLYFLLAGLVQQPLIIIIVDLGLLDLHRINGMVKSSGRTQHLAMESFSYKFLFSGSLFNVVGQRLQIKALRVVLFAGHCA